MARREKKPVHKVVMTDGKRNIIQQLLQVQIPAHLTTHSAKN
ncbi:hypothetical protein ACTM9N_14265 [Lachnospiraceae bacterium HCP1S3_A8]